MLEFQQSESTAERRRWILVLVDSADGVTGLTGQTGTVKVSKNGGAAADSTNSIVEVDAGDMPGHYYVELTAGELDTLGFVSITKKTASSLAFHDRALVSYNDPYISAGGFSSGGTGQQFKLTEKHVEAIAKKVWEYNINERPAQELLLDATIQSFTDLSGLDAKISSIVIPEVDLEPVLERIDSIVIPRPNDYSKELTGISGQLASFNKILPVELSAFQKSLDNVKSVVDSLSESLTSNSGELGKLNEVSIQLQETIKELDELSGRYGETLKERTDIKQWLIDNKAEEFQKELAGVRETIVKLAKELIQVKYDIIEELK